MSDQGLDVGRLYSALDSKRKSSGISWRQLAKEAGVSPSTITRMKDNKRPDVDGFAALVQWLGMPADAFLPSSPKKVQADPAAEIMTYLRAKRELEPASVDAIQDLIQAACKLLKKKK